MSRIERRHKRKWNQLCAKSHISSSRLNYHPSAMSAVVPLSHSIAYGSSFNHSNACNGSSLYVHCRPYFGSSPKRRWSGYLTVACGSHSDTHCLRRPSVNLYSSTRWSQWLCPRRSSAAMSVSGTPSIGWSRLVSRAIDFCSPSSHSTCCLHSARSCCWRTTTSFRAVID